MNPFLRKTVLFSVALLTGVAAYEIFDRWLEQSWPGFEATPGQFPHVAILRNSSTKKHFCSGAIVSKRSIVTAAHCVNGVELATFEVVVGTILNNVTPDEQNVYDVARVVVHPDYKQFANDIAIVHTARDIRFDDDVDLIKLGTIRDEVGAKLYPTGWSRYNVNIL